MQARAEQNAGSRWIGVVAAFRWEVSALLRKDVAVKRLNPGLYSLSLAGRPVVLAISGLGMENAFRAAQALVCNFPLQSLLTVGFAGALAEHLTPGDVVLADRVIEESTQQRFECQRDLLPVRFTERGTLLCVRDMVASADEKRQLGQRWNAAAVDMESAGVAQAALGAGIPFGAVKSITDSSQQTISIDFKRCRSEHHGLSSRGILREGIRTRHGVRDLWRLAQGARRAAGSLATALYVM
ncbi:MAG: hypothetical protein HY647_09620 [Acidobacteria bacterium]|nr:hypothetical protein [Acidobacteriota bacterium]